MAVLGVDGWRGRWVGALLDGRRVTLLDLPDAAAVLAVPDVEAVAIDPPTDREVEVHPELAFRALDERVGDPKGSARGLAQRMAALAPVMDLDLLDAPPLIPAADVLDACAAAWSAHRITAGTAECLGDGAVDRRGRPMRICF